MPKHIYEAKQKEKEAEERRRESEPPRPKTEYVQESSVEKPKHINETRKKEEEAEQLKTEKTSKGKITLNSIKQAIKKVLGRGER